MHGPAAPFTVNTMPDSTLEAFYDHGEVDEPMPADGGDRDAVLHRLTDAGVDLTALAERLHRPVRSASARVTEETLRLLIELARDSSTNVLTRHYRRLKEI